MDTATKLPVKTGSKESPRQQTGLQAWRPFDRLRREVDRLFSEFDGGFWPTSLLRSTRGAEPLWQRELTWEAAPPVNIVEKEGAYEVTAELPGMDEKNIEVSLANGELTIKGEKQEEKEEKRKDYYLRERQFGSFERYFPVPESVDMDKIAANFSKGVLTVTLPKKPEAQKAAKKIEVRAA